MEKERATIMKRWEMEVRERLLKEQKTVASFFEYHTEVFIEVFRKLWLTSLQSLCLPVRRVFSEVIETFHPS